MRSKLCSLNTTKLCTSRIWSSSSRKFQKLLYSPALNKALDFLWLWRGPSQSYRNRVEAIEQTSQYLLLRCSASYFYLSNTSGRESQFFYFIWSQHSSILVCKLHGQCVHNWVSRPLVLPMRFFHRFHTPRQLRLPLHTFACPWLFVYFLPLNVFWQVLHLVYSKFLKELSKPLVLSSIVLFELLPVVSFRLLQ
jgi:hypothetical protein